MIIVNTSISTRLCRDSGYASADFASGAQQSTRFPTTQTYIPSNDGYAFRK
ncbi:MAG: hypothetical protein ACUZ8I_01430 [Candidatus Scalindua sp.]